MNKDEKVFFMLLTITFYIFLVSPFNTERANAVFFFASFLATFTIPSLFSVDCADLRRPKE